jgi:hypothetical protein
MQYAGWWIWADCTRVHRRRNALCRASLKWVALANHLAAQATEHARQEGVSTEALVNLWIAERLADER